VDGVVAEPVAKEIIMRVFVTGATGFVGSHLVPELLSNGHQVLGLARSDEGAAALIAAGAEVRRGTIEDVAGLAEAAAGADGVVHLAFNHDFSRFAENSANDARAVAALGAGLAGSARPLLVTSGTAIAHVPEGQLATEDDPAVGADVTPRAMSEEAAREVAAAGGNIGIVRLAQIHDPRRQGLISFAIQVALEKGVSAYIDDGAARWPAAPVGDAARLYRLALEKAAPGAIYNCVAEQGVAMRDVADVLGRKLKLPVRSVAMAEAEAHFGWLAHFMRRDLAASSAKTRAALGWQPSGPGLLEDLERLEL
jgi:nucleoside-diphosphate-sugar epimerase